MVSFIPGGSPVVTYQSNFSLVMINIDQSANHPRAPAINDNLLSPFEGTSVGYLDSPFACVNDQVVPSNYSRRFTRCITGNSGGYDSEIVLGDKFWEYDANAIGDVKEGSILNQEFFCT